MSINPSSTGCCVPLLDGTTSSHEEMVKSVNLILPDGTGNISIVKEDIPGILFSDTPTFANIYTIQDRVHLGSNAGSTLQGANSVAVGPTAGQTSQGAKSVAIGHQTGQLSQSGGSTAIGDQSGAVYQEAESVAIGNKAQYGFGKVAVTTQPYGIAIGFEAQLDGKQDTNSIAIGHKAGSSLQGESSIGIGHLAGSTIQNPQCVAIGTRAGELLQEYESVAIGYEAGNNSQGFNNVAIGYRAAHTFQGDHSIAIGNDTGRVYQENSAIAIGQEAQEGVGKTADLANHFTVAIGHGAQRDGKHGYGAIGIGRDAGSVMQGENSVALGYLATLPHAVNSIVLNASGVSTYSHNTGSLPGNECCVIATKNPRQMPTTYADGSFHVDCVRNQPTRPNYLVTYDLALKEIKYCDSDLIDPKSSDSETGAMNSIPLVETNYYNDKYIVLSWSMSIAPQYQPKWKYDDTFFPLPGGSGEYLIYAHIIKYVTGGLGITRSSSLGSTALLTPGNFYFYTPAYDNSFNWVNNDTYYECSLRFIGANGNCLQYKTTVCGESPGLMGYSAESVASADFIPF